MEKHQILIIWNFLLIFATSFAAKNTSEANVCSNLTQSNVDEMVIFILYTF